jgi:hypothetical protein
VLKQSVPWPIKSATDGGGSNHITADAKNRLRNGNRDCSDRVYTPAPDDVGLVELQTLASRAATIDNGNDTDYDKDGRRRNLVKVCCG